MQAIITQEEWEEYQRLKRESVADGNVIDLRVADELEKIADGLKSHDGGKTRNFLSFDDLVEAVKASAHIIRGKLSK